MDEEARKRFVAAKQAEAAEKSANEAMREFNAKRAREAEQRAIERDMAFGIATTALQAVRILVKELRKKDALSPGAKQALSELELGGEINALLREDRALDRELRRETPKSRPD